MLKEAARQGLIASNPFDKINKLIAHNREVQILKSDEVQKLFPEKWDDVWDSYEIYLFNKLAACTGMRLSEIMGLQGKHIYADHIHVCIQYSKKYGVQPLKTKDSRNIPITAPLHKELSVLTRINGVGFAFSESNGINPIFRSRVYRETGRAFDKIGIDRSERLKRGIALHQWRHFLNTALLMANVNTLKVQKVTGHKSLSMTRHYTHFDSKEFTEILDVQNNLIAPGLKEPPII
jgi:integrase